MTYNCRAKDPSICRVHGTTGAVSRLQGIADSAAKSNNMELYFSSRAMMDNLLESEDGDTVNFIFPNTGNMILGNWVDENKEIVKEAPTDMLVRNLYTVSGTDTDQNRIKELLGQRGYEEKDIFLAKVFSFRKEDTGHGNAKSISGVDPYRAAYTLEALHGVTLEKDVRETLVKRNFSVSDYECIVTRERCQKFRDDYEQFLSFSKNLANL